MNHPYLIEIRMQIDVITLIVAIDAEGIEAKNARLLSNSMVYESWN
jgi:hypothetical protein